MQNALMTGHIGSALLNLSTQSRRRLAQQKIAFGFLLSAGHSLPTLILHICEGLNMYTFALSISPLYSPSLF
ncbi:MAG: hypothetical protein ACJAYN_001995 [Bermanella sp.]|jgi:hypothetical protein